MSDDYYLDPRVAAAYDAQPGLLQDDVPFYLDLARTCGVTGGAVLELGCGTGRVTLPIANAGIEVTGLDSSAAMLAVARQCSAGRTNPRWVDADMAHFELNERFGLVIIPCRSFGLLLTDEAQKACLDRAFEHLLPGGRLALNLVDPSLVLRARGLARPQVASNAATERVIVHVERNLRQRLVSRDDMERLLIGAGFVIEALYGWFDGSAFGPESSEQVWVARRP